MSNGLTAVFLDVLAIAGSDLAATDWEKRLVYWLVQHDQSRVGVGCAGFDVAQLGWERDTLEAQKRFVLTVIDAALARHGWERLPFSPRKDWALASLKHFRELVVAATPDDVGAPTERKWFPDELPPHGLCEKHHVYLHEAGCILCNGS